MENLDPQGTLVVPVQIPDIIVERFYPYLDSTPFGRLLLDKPRDPHADDDGVKRYDLGGVTLETAVDEREVTSATRGYTPTRLLLTYGATYPLQERDNVHKDVYARRLAQIMFKSSTDTSVSLEPLRDQRRRAEIAERKSGMFSGLLRYLRIQEDPIPPTADEQYQAQVREARVSSEELAAITGLLRTLKS